MTLLTRRSGKTTVCFGMRSEVARREQHREQLVRLPDLQKNMLPRTLLLLIMLQNLSNKCLKLHVLILSVQTVVAPPRSLLQRLFLTLFASARTLSSKLICKCHPLQLSPMMYGNQNCTLFSNHSVELSHQISLYRTRISFTRLSNAIYP